MVKKTSTVPGSELAPDMTARTTSARYWYWIGLTVDCPAESMVIGGVSFPKKTAQVIPNKASAIGTSKTFWHAGSVIALSMSQIERIKLRLPKRVLRYQVAGNIDDVTWKENGGVVPLRKSPSGHPCAIGVPVFTEEEAEIARQRGRMVRAYEPTENDHALVEFVYMQPLKTSAPQHRPIDATLPPPLAETGLAMPEDDWPAMIPGVLPGGSTTADENDQFSRAARTPADGPAPVDTIEHRMVD